MPRRLVLKPIDGNFSLKDHIYEVLKDGITSMNIYAEDAELKLDERQLSEQLRISRTPIREALARLEQEGLVRIMPRKGVMIVRKSVDEILEMIIAWAALESMAARLATSRASDAEIGSLRKMLAKFSQEEVRTHIDEYSETNIKFHQRILELSKCALLEAHRRRPVPPHAGDPRPHHGRGRPGAPLDRRSRPHHRSARSARRRSGRAPGARAHAQSARPRPAHLGRAGRPRASRRARPIRRRSEGDMSTTATDTLQRRSTDANVISGGHLAAKALKNEGVDTIFTLCGGHIIDIYDGCLDEGIRIIDVRHEQVAAHAADGYARQTGKLGCVVTTAGPGCTNAMTGIACASRAETPILHIGGQGALDPAQDGLAAGPAARRHDGADHQVRRHRARRPSGSPTWSAWRRASATTAPGGRPTSRSRATCSTARSTLAKAVIPEPGHYRASTRSIGDPADIEKLADLLVNAERPVHPARHPGLELPRPRGGDRAGAPAQHPGLLQRLRPRPAAARRSAPLQPHPPHGVRQGRRDRDRRHAVRLPHGLRPPPRQGRRRGADRPGLPHGRQEPRHRARPGRPSGRDPRRGRAGRLGPRRQPRQEPARLDGGAAGRGAEGDRQADAAVPVRQHADPSLPGGLGDQRVPRPRTRSTSATAATWSRSAPRRCSRASPGTGWIPARSARSASAPASPWRPSSPSRTRRCSATTATAPSA